MLRYYFDENVYGAIPKQLRKRGIDVLRAEEVGRAGKGIPDSDQLAYATSLGRVLVTKEKREFPALHKQLSHAGIMILQREDSLGNYIDYLEAAALVYESEYMRNRLEYYDW